MQIPPNIGCTRCTSRVALRTRTSKWIEKVLSNNWHVIYQAPLKDGKKVKKSEKAGTTKSQDRPAGKTQMREILQALNEVGNGSWIWDRKKPWSFMKRLAGADKHCSELYTIVFFSTFCDVMLGPNFKTCEDVYWFPTDLWSWPKIVAIAWESAASVEILLQLLQPICSTKGVLLLLFKMTSPWVLCGAAGLGPHCQVAFPTCGCTETAATGGGNSNKTPNLGGWQTAGSMLPPGGGKSHHIAQCSVLRTETCWNHN